VGAPATPGTVRDAPRAAPTPIQTGDREMHGVGNCAGTLCVSAQNFLRDQASNATSIFLFAGRSGAQKPAPRQSHVSPAEECRAADTRTLLGVANVAQREKCSEMTCPHRSRATAGLTSP